MTAAATPSRRRKSQFQSNVRRFSYLPPWGVGSIATCFAFLPDESRRDIAGSWYGSSGLATVLDQEFLSNTSPGYRGHVWRAFMMDDVTSTDGVRAINGVVETQPLTSVWLPLAWRKEHSFVLHQRFSLGRFSANGEEASPSHFVPSYQPVLTFLSISDVSR
jgi:hypothetical protein